MPNQLDNSNVARDRVQALADRVEASRQRALGPRYAGHEVPSEFAVMIVLIGVVCCTLGWWIAPASGTADVAESWYALVLGTLFWMCACMAALGLYLRLRSGLLAALMCALSFLGAVVVDASLDATVVGVHWAIELTCALVFGLACIGALLLIRREPERVRPSHLVRVPRRPQP